MVEKSKVIGIMLQHSDGDKEYYEPEWLTDADFEALKNEIKEIQEYEAENVQ